MSTIDHFTSADPALLRKDTVAKITATIKSMLSSPLLLEPKLQASVRWGSDT